MTTIYKVGIVGESNYQPAIRRCAIGGSARVLHEIGNPHDPRALVVVASGGNTIGYIPRDNWLQRAIHDEGQGCAATIASIETAAGGQLGVVLDVALNGAAIGERSYGDADRASAVPFGVIPVSLLIVFVILGWALS